MYFYRGVCKKTAQNSIFRLMFWCFRVLNFRRVKNSYLIRPLSKNSNFLWEMLFFCSKHECKKAWKSSTSRTGLALEKNCDFAWFGRKIKINRDLVEMLRNFIDTSIKIHIDDVKSFVTFRISVDFFLFFQLRLCAFRSKKKKKNQDLFRMLRNFSHHLYVFL